MRTQSINFRQWHSRDRHKCCENVGLYGSTSLVFLAFVSPGLKAGAMEDWLRSHKAWGIDFGFVAYSRVRLKSREVLGSIDLKAVVTLALFDNNPHYKCYSLVLKHYKCSRTSGCSYQSRTKINCRASLPVFTGQSAPLSGWRRLMPKPTSVRPPSSPQFLDQKQA